MVETRTLKRIAPLQLAKILALLYGAMGLLFVPVFLIVSIGGAASGGFGSSLTGLGFALLAPLMYAAMGFVTGLLGAAIYNVVAGWIGGLRVEVE